MVALALGRQGASIARYRRRLRRGRRCFPADADVEEKGLPGRRRDDYTGSTMSLRDINPVFDLMHEGKSIRSVIHFLGVLP
jgi:hypothetical protein